MKKVFIVGASLVLALAAGYVFAGSTFTLSVVKIGNGSGRVVSSPSGIHCGNICTAQFSFATGTIYLNAFPDGSSSFGGWMGCTHSTGTKCILDVTGEVPSSTIIAKFNKTSR